MLLALASLFSLYPTQDKLQPTMSQWIWTSGALSCRLPSQSANGRYSAICMLRYKAGYPNTELELRLHNEKGLSLKQTKALSKELRQLSSQHAAAGEVSPPQSVEQCWIRSSGGGH